VSSRFGRNFIRLWSVVGSLCDDVLLSILLSCNGFGVWRFLGLFLLLRLGRLLYLFCLGLLTQIVAHDFSEEDFRFSVKV
jgi:hypothetical protein